MLGLHSLDGPPERVPISTGVCGDQRVAALISVAVVCGDQYNAVLISVMCGRLGRSPCITMTMVVNQMWSARPERVPISTDVCADQHGCVCRSVCRYADHSVAAVCDDQCDDVLISVMCG